MDELKTTIQEVMDTREKIGYVKGLNDCLEVIKEYINSAETIKMLIEEKMMEALDE